MVTPVASECKSVDIGACVLAASGYEETKNGKVCSFVNFIRTRIQSLQACELAVNVWKSETFSGLTATHDNHR